MKYGETVTIQKAGYDKYNATQWAISATDLGLPLEEYSQSLGNFNKPTRDGKAAIREIQTREQWNNEMVLQECNPEVRPQWERKA